MLFRSATFTAIEYAITTSSVSNGTILVNATKATIGTMVTVTANANEGYRLERITVNGSAINGNTFKMPAGDVTVSATFVAEEYSITVNTDGNGSARANVNVAKKGDTVTITVTPNDNYELDKVLVNNKTEGLSFTMPAGNVTVTVSFKLKQTSSSSSETSSSSSIEESSSNEESSSSDSSSSSEESSLNSSSSSSEENSSESSSSSSYKPANRGGCNSSIASSLGLLPLCLIAMAIIVFLKKRNND